jgi:hypothetical protein
MVTEGSPGCQSTADTGVEASVEIPNEGDLPDQREGAASTDVASLIPIVVQQPTTNQYYKHRQNQHNT